MESSPQASRLVSHFCVLVSASIANGYPKRSLRKHRVCIYTARSPLVRDESLIPSQEGNYL